MVLLSTVQAFNSLIACTLPPGLVAVFVGATSGIGEATLKQFATHARQPRAYFIGRSQAAADRIAAECTALNPDGTYTFIKADVSLIKVVDKVCEEIKAKEKVLNILCLSQGAAIMDRRGTALFPYLPCKGPNHTLLISLPAPKKPPKASTTSPPSSTTPACAS